VNPNIAAPLRFDRALACDALAIGCDGLLGIVAAVILFSSSANLSTILLGSIGAMLPDPLQFMYIRFPHEPLRTLQQLHRWAHTDRQITEQVTVGIISQLSIVIVSIIIAETLHHGLFDMVALAHGHG
jgi:hypothetical protein